MPAEANQTSPATGEEAQPSSSWVKTFALVAVATLLILGGIGIAIYMLGGDNLPMNYGGYDNK